MMAGVEGRVWSEGLGWAVGGAVQSAQGAGSSGPKARGRSLWAADAGGGQVASEGKGTKALFRWFLFCQLRRKQVVCGD